MGSKLALLSVATIRLHDGGLHDVGSGEGPRALVTPENPIRVGVGLYKNELASLGKVD